MGGGLDPVGPSAVGGADADFVSCLQSDRVAILFLVVGVSDEHGERLRTENHMASEMRTLIAFAMRGRGVPRIRRSF